MISTVTDGNIFEFRGLSTDPKPNNSHLGNGCTFFEMDTGKVFMLKVEEEESGGLIITTRTWLEI